MCFLGLPALLFVLAGNQKGIATGLDERAIARSLGTGAQVPPERIREELRALLESREVRQTMSEHGRALVDGIGAARVATLLQSEVRLRRTSQDDCHLLWKWANEPQTRAASFSSAAIPWESHVGWFETKLADPNAILYTAVNPAEIPVGYTRFQRSGDAATISLSLGREFRGQGRGRTLLLLACERVFAESDVKQIDAYVKPDNEPSLRLFAGAGFVREGTESLHGQAAVHFVHKKAFAP
jgi:RimJ/RimL family protein N-acetyltransferase